MEPAVAPEMVEVGYAILLDAFNLDFSRSSPDELRLIVTAIYQAMEQERRRAFTEPAPGADWIGFV
jgi:hypothetical protein